MSSQKSFDEEAFISTLTVALSKNLPKIPHNNIRILVAQNYESVLTSLAKVIGQPEHWHEVINRLNKADYFNPNSIFFFDSDEIYELVCDKVGPNYNCQRFFYTFLDHFFYDSGSNCYWEYESNNGFCFVENHAFYRPLQSNDKDELVALLAKQFIENYSRLLTAMD